MLVLGSSQLYSLFYFASIVVCTSIALKAIIHFQTVLSAVFTACIAATMSFTIHYIPEYILPRMRCRCLVQLVQTTPLFAVPLPSMWPILTAATQAGGVSLALQHGVHCMQHDPLFNTDIDHAPNLSRLFLVVQHVMNSSK